MKTTLSALIALGALTGAALASNETFDFKDPKNGNNAMFKLVAPRETIEGSANGVSGTITFDPENPASTKGKIVVAAKTLMVPNGMMRQHLHSNKWLDVEKFPEIAFEVKELKNVKADGDKTSGEATGTFTLHGVSKEITVPVALTYLKDKLSQRVPGKQGDLLVVRTSFSIQRSDFDVNAHQNEDKVSDTIQLTLGIAGAAAR